MGTVFEHRKAWPNERREQAKFVDLAGSEKTPDFEAGAGIEPANSGFADRDLTTWLPRRLRRIETNASA
jgi:hypothetical protein